MSSLIQQPGGRKTVHIMVDGSRRTIALGKRSKTSALAMQVKLDQLREATAAGEQPTSELMAWADGLDESLRARVVRAGLLPKSTGLTVSAAIDEHLERKGDTIGRNAKSRLRVNMEHLRRTMGDKAVVQVAESDAEAMRSRLLSENKAEATIRKCLSDARGLFKVLKDAGTIAVNPFMAVRVSAVATTRHFFVSQELSLRILEELPTPHWRLLFALARWGAFRTPSEGRRMTRSHIDLERGRITVMGKRDNDSQLRPREMPIFDEIAGPLDEVLGETDSGLDARLLAGLTDRDTPPRTPLEHAIKRCGAEVWPRLWHNLRSTRLTELVATRPLHVVCRFCGLTPEVAAKHYLQITDADYELALSDEGSRP